MSALPFLLEIGVEEIPHWMIEPALAHIQTAFIALLEQNNLAVPELKLDATPRRLVLRAAALPERQSDREDLVMGPPKSAGPGAAAGFAKKNGATLEDLRTEVTPKGEYFALLKKIEGRDTRAILAEALPTLIAKIPWPKAMYWTGKDGVRFIRPIRWIAALLGDQIVEFELAGVKSGALSRGHRRMGAAEVVFDHSNYEERLEKNGVILSAAKRKDKITAGIKKLLRGKKLKLAADPGLLNDLAYLTEFPTPILGDFDPKFLELPSEVLVTVMRHHQRYFSLHDAQGNLAPHFVAVTNIKSDRNGLVKKGNERVLAARFNDGRFFYDFDQQKPLATRVESLAHVTFHAKLGSYLEKTVRMKKVAADLGLASPEVLRAIDLCKCDLTTEMVKEFTDLQGVVGGLYAKAQGEPEPVWRAIYDHYKPLSMEDSIPASAEGRALSLADKIDTLQSCFRIGLQPTGSKDPFALRRAAQGVVRILVEANLRIPLRFFDGELREFMMDRIRYYFRDIKGFAYDEINAVFAAAPADLVEASARLWAVKQVRQTENFEPLAAAFKRIRNILKQADWKSGEVNPALFENAAETDLHAGAQRVKAVVAERRAAGDFIKALQAVASLRPAVDKFFDDVLVNAPDERVRANRLALLGGLLTEFSSIADFSEIVTGSTTE